MATNAISCQEQRTKGCGMKEQDNIDLSGASLADVVAKPKRASLALKAIALDRKSVV